MAYKQQKNYRSNNNRRHTGPSHKRSHTILPPVAVLDRYGEEGKARLITLAEEEQIHRHDWEAAYLRAYLRSHRLGQFFGFILAAAIIYVSYDLAKLGNNDAAIAIAVSGFLAIIVSAFVGMKTKRFNRRPRKPQTQKSQSEQVSEETVEEDE